MTSTGSCLCGNLQYEFTGEPAGKAVCYCLSCQKISGGTHTVNLQVPAQNFHVTHGHPKQYTKVHESGMNLTVNFCDNCGGVTHKTADNELFQGYAVVQVGTQDSPKGFDHAKPQLELYTKYRAPWLSGFGWTTEKSEF